MKTELLPLETVLVSYKPTPAAGQSWSEIKEEILSSPARTLIVGELREQLRKSTSFKNPIILDPRTNTVVEGYHRIVATWVEGREGILTAGTSWRPVEAVPYSFQFKAAPSEQTLKYVTREEDACDVATIFLFSLPTSNEDNPWVTCGFASTMPDEGDLVAYDFVYEWSGSLEDLKTAFDRRLQQFDLEAKDLKIEVLEN